MEVNPIEFANQIMVEVTRAGFGVAGAAFRFVGSGAVKALGAFGIAIAKHTLHKGGRKRVWKSDILKEREKIMFDLPDTLRSQFDTFAKKSGIQYLRWPGLDKNNGFNGNSHCVIRLGDMELVNGFLKECKQSLIGDDAIKVTPADQFEAQESQSSPTLSMEDAIKVKATEAHTVNLEEVNQHKAIADTKTPKIKQIDWENCNIVEANEIISQLGPREEKSHELDSDPSRTQNPVKSAKGYTKESKMLKDEGGTTKNSLTNNGGIRKRIHAIEQRRKAQGSQLALKLKKAPVITNRRK